MEQVMIYKMRNVRAGLEVVCKINMVNGWQHKGFKVVGGEYYPISIPLHSIEAADIPDNLEGFNPLDQSSSSEKFKRFKPKYNNGKRPRR
jgi:hypothetical protein